MWIVYHEFSTCKARRAALSALSAQQFQLHMLALACCISVGPARLPHVKPLCTGYSALSTMPRACTCCYQSARAQRLRPRRPPAPGNQPQSQRCTDTRVTRGKRAKGSGHESHDQIGALAAVGGLPVCGCRGRGGQQRLPVRHGRALIGDHAHRLGQPLHALLLRSLRSSRLCLAWLD